MITELLAEKKRIVRQIVDDNASLIKEVGSTIWNFAEKSREELNSSEFLAKKLEDLGFILERGIGGYPTAFLATYSTGNGPVLGLLCEYDALPGLSSQKKGGNGHGCGHNLFAAGAIGTAAVMKKFIDEEGISATIKVFGTPAEEEYASKPFFVKQGIFDGVDCFMGFHPLEFNGVLYSRHNAIISAKYRFFGKTSHAGAEPELGISALDALEIMNVAVNYLREHVTQDVRIHYIITDGGIAANVVPDYAASSYAIRAQDFENLYEVYEKVNNTARAGALATGCRVEWEMVEAFANTVLNRPFAELAYNNMLEIGAPEFDENDDKAVFEMGLDKGYDRNIRPLPAEQGAYTASTDEGDVSWKAPWIRICMAALAEGTPGHSVEVVKQSNLPAAYKGVNQTVKVCCSTLVDILMRPDELSRIKRYYEEATKGKSLPVVGEKYPNPKFFPNALGVKITSGNTFEINREETVFLRKFKNVEEVNIVAYFNDEIAGEALLKKEEDDCTVRFSKKVESGEVVVLKYRTSKNEKETLFGYINI